MAVLNTLAPVEGADGAEHFACMTWPTVLHPVSKFFSNFLAEYLAALKNNTNTNSRMEFVEEFEESTQLKPHIVATYTFFKQFSVLENGTLNWNTHSYQLQSTETAEKLRKLLKYFRGKLKSQELSRDGCGRAMLFWYSKLLEFGCFSLEVQMAIQSWMEICELIVS